MPENTAKNILSDIEVETVGLVPQGAVSVETDDDGNPTGANFFLLKAKEGFDVPDELVIEAVDTIEEQPLPDTVSDTDQANEEVTLFERFKNFLNRQESVAEPVPDYIDEGGQNEPPGEDEVMAKSNDEANAVEAIFKAQVDLLQQQHQAQLEAILKATEDKYQNQLTSLHERVAKAEAQASEADEKRQKREYVEKAGKMMGLGVDKLELADKLYQLAKADRDLVEYFEGLLKAADAQLGAAGIFAEMGTAQSPEELELMDKVNKSTQEGRSVEDALLSLSEDEQNALLKEMRGGK